MLPFVEGPRAWTRLARSTERGAHIGLGGLGVNWTLMRIDIGQNIVHITAMTAISYSYARENLKAVIDQAIADRAPIAITRQRGEGAVLISASEWASIEETLYLLRSPANAKHLLESIAELDAGKGEAHELIYP